VRAAKNHLVWKLTTKECMCRWATFQEPSCCIVRTCKLHNSRSSHFQRIKTTSSQFTQVKTLIQVLN